MDQLQVCHWLLFLDHVLHAELFADVAEAHEAALLHLHGVACEHLLHESILLVLFLLQLVEFVNHDHIEINRFLILLLPSFNFIIALRHVFIQFLFFIDEYVIH